MKTPTFKVHILKRLSNKLLLAGICYFFWETAKLLQYVRGNICIKFKNKVLLWHFFRLTIWNHKTCQYLTYQSIFFFFFQKSLIYWLECCAGTVLFDLQYLESFYSWVKDVTFFTYFSLDYFSTQSLVKPSLHLF